MSDKKYQVIYADPPWKYSNKASNGAQANHYPGMTMTEMKAMRVEDIAAKDAVLCMWYTGNFTSEAMDLARAWGFEVRSMKLFTWMKLNALAEQHINKALKNAHQDYRPVDFDFLMDLINDQLRMNGGNYTRANTEDVLIAVRGKGLERKAKNIKQAIFSPLQEHSRKPEEARARIERLYGDVDRVELFARQAVGGWDVWGNQAPGHISLPAIDCSLSEFKVDSGNAKG